VPDHVFLLIIDFTYIIKGLVQLRLMPVLGPVYAILKMLLKEVLVFGIFFFLQQFIFSVIGNLLFFKEAEYDTLSEAMLTIFKASAGVFNKDTVVSSQDFKEETTTKYIFLLSYMIVCFILISNLIVG
jgi:hypothetical protein